jgi:hypothetical protein
MVNGNQHNHQHRHYGFKGAHICLNVDITSFAVTSELREPGQGLPIIL